MADECGDSVVVKLQILGLTFSPIRLGLWSTSWCECSYSETSSLFRWQFVHN